MSAITAMTTSTRQRGAALIVSLLLLLVLTMLAVSGMNTASLELMMAGNEQYRQRAFHAAEAGIETEYQTALFTGVVEGPRTTQIAETASQYTTTVTPQLDGNAVPAFSWGKANNLSKFQMLHFEITSLGRSTRDAQTTHTQGIGVLIPGGETLMPGPNFPSARFE